MEVGEVVLRVEQYGRLSLLLAVAEIVIILAMVYRDKLEKIVAHLHLKNLEKKAKQRDCGG